MNSKGKTNTIANKKLPEKLIKCFNSWNTQKDFANTTQKCGKIVSCVCLFICVCMQICLCACVCIRL